MADINFRKDINGLRALAVISVLIFHFNSEYLPGGFAGVDVFFVISGYLMTRIILSGLSENKFSVKRFYMARARRIIPALAITCLLTMIIGWLFISPADFYEMGKDVASSILFVSNFLYLSRSGYFDDSAVNNFLLHTWSLSVEWQFYIIYPLLLMTITKLFGLKATKSSIVIMFIISFCASLYGTYNFAEASYYMFPMRAWAMLAGGLAYIIHTPTIMRKTLGIIGLLSILLSVVIINKETPWPGIMSLLPISGAFLCIYSNSSLGFYSFRPFQLIGSISYELYLIHWPLLTFARKLDVNISFTWYIISTFIISWFLNKSLDILKSNKKLHLSFAASLVFCLLIISNHGYADRVPEQYRLTKADFHKKYYGGVGYPANKVFYINSKVDSFKYIVIGDSFGLQYAKAFDENKLQAAAIFKSGCLILPNYTRYQNNKEDVLCSGMYDKVKPIIDANPTTPVILASSWNSYDGQMIKKGHRSPVEKGKDKYQELVLSEILSIIKEGGNKRTYYIVGRPQGTKIDGFGCLAGQSLLGYRFLSSCKNTQDKVDVEINYYLRDNLSKLSNVKFIDPNEALCDKNGCKIIYNREPVYTDYGHLSVYGASLVAKYIINNL